MDADVFISLTHFKGHESAGFGGALKNIGMGCGSRAGKMEQHNAGKPHVAAEALRGLRRLHPASAPTAASPWTDRKASHRPQQVRGLRPVHRRVPRGRHRRVNLDESATNLNRKIAEYAQAVVDGRPCFHISPGHRRVSLTATAIRRTTRPSSPMWVCSPPLTRWPWTWPAWTR